MPTDTNSNTPVCTERGCSRPPRMAVSTTRPQRDSVVVAIWTDDRAAKVPQKSPRYCQKHGALLVDNLLSLLVGGDDT